MAVTPTERARRRGCASSAWRCPTSPASTCSATARDGSSTSARRSRCANVSPRTSPRPRSPQPRARRDGRRCRAHRVRCRGHRGRGPAGRAELHQTVPAALQHPPARRQVLPLHRDLTRRGLSARLLHARAPPRRRAYFGPYSNAKRVRSTLEVLAKVFMFRSCTGPSPAGAAAPVPRLLHQALRGALRGLCQAGGVPRLIDGVIDFLVGPLRGDRARPRGRACGRRRRPRSSSRRRSSATACRRSARCSSDAA